MCIIWWKLLFSSFVENSPCRSHFFVLVTWYKSSSALNIHYLCSNKGYLCTLKQWGNRDRDRCDLPCLFFRNWICLAHSVYDFLKPSVMNDKVLFILQPSWTSSSRLALLPHRIRQGLCLQWNEKFLWGLKLAENPPPLLGKVKI